MDLSSGSRFIYRNIPLFRRSLKILAESYAIKGLCLENLGNKGGSKFKQAERTTEMVCVQFVTLQEENRLFSFSFFCFLNFLIFPSFFLRPDHMF